MYFCDSVVKSFFASLIAVSTVSACRKFRSFAPPSHLCYYRPIDFQTRF